MAQAAFSGEAEAGHPMDPEQAVAAADERLAAAADLLARQVALGPCRLLDDETVARVRALMRDLAAQLAGADRALIDPLRDMLAANRAILAHCHALAVEWRLAMTLAARRGIDPVLPPLMRRRIDATGVGDDVAAVSTALLAAQTRLGENVRRMSLPLAELPADLQNLARAMLGAARADRSEAALMAEVPHHVAPDEGHGRLALLYRVVAGLGEDMAMALRIDEAGVPLFFTALAIASGHPREAVILACAEDDALRLALLLRAAGLSRDEAAHQLLALRPDADWALVDAVHDAAAAETALGGAR